MSLPPNTINIKRRRTDEPVDFLRVQELNGKKRRTDDFVFSRQPTTITESDSTVLTTEPHNNRPIKPLHRSIISSQGGLAVQDEHNASTIVGGASATLSKPQTAKDPASQTTGPEIKPRRFHMSRGSIQNTAEFGKGRKRSATNSLTFIERKARRLPLGGKGAEENNKNDPITPDPSLLETPRARKKPGLSSRSRGTTPNVAVIPETSPAPNAVPSPQNIRLPNGKVMPWDVNSDLLAAEMQAYTLQEIGRNMEETNKRDSHTPSPILKATPSRFKPKKPALRYAERHPEEAAELNEREKVDVDEWSSGNDDMDDESEYIIDTYVRMPADVLRTSGSLKNFGLLVLESQPDIDEFYLEEQDSEEEYENEDEDENAENHYSADYPDDEVDSDDEFDRNPYSYRYDAFDEDDASFSGDEKPSWLKHGDASDAEDDDDT